MIHVFDFADAKFSPDGLYRYRLDRGWPGGTGRIVWILCNPSTADEVRPDPTVRKVVLYSQLWGFNALTVVNMFGWRARDPKRLVEKLRARDVDVVGPENDNWVREALCGAQAVVLGWGSLALRDVMRKRAEVLLALVRAAQLAPTCLAVNDDGMPTHPLYLANDLRPVPYEARAATA